MRFDQHFVKGVLPEAVIPFCKYPDDIGFSVDTRTLQPGNMFVALSGAQADGHNFLAQALQKNAAGFIIASSKKDLLATLDQNLLKNKLVIIVNDVLQAFIKLACAWRDQFNYPVVGITGSVGKTSTKEIIKSILHANNIPFIASEGNQNTRVGVAINIFKMRSNHQVAIFELGISKRGEMAELAKIARPINCRNNRNWPFSYGRAWFIWPILLLKNVIFLNILVITALALLMVINPCLPMLGIIIR